METITAHEAARRSGIPVAEIYRSIDAGDVAGFRVDSEIRLRVGDLARLGLEPKT